MPRKKYSDEKATAIRVFESTLDRVKNEKLKSEQNLSATIDRILNELYELRKKKGVKN